MKLSTTLLFLLAPFASAFVTPQGTTTKVALQSAVGGDKDKFDPQELLSKLPDVSSIDFKALDLEVIKDNILEGEVGERGEAYAAAQFALLACILAGGIPVVGDLMMVLLGPCLLLAGAAAFGLSVRDLGGSWSPWTVPTKDGDLVEDGIYAKLRHPQYAGLLAAMAGFSIVTGSANRLLLTAVLFYVFGEMADKEEAELAKKFPDYNLYKKSVPGKFFPDEITQQLPWNNQM